MCAFIHIYMYVYIYVYMYIYIHTNVCIHTHIYIHYNPNLSPTKQHANSDLCPSPSVCHNWCICVSLICVLCLIHTCAMTHSHMCNKPTCQFRLVPFLFCVPQLTRVCDMTPVQQRRVWVIEDTWMCHGAYMHELWHTKENPSLIHICEMTHLYVCHDSFIYAPWLIHVCAMTHSYVCHDTLQCINTSAHRCTFPPSQMCHDSFICVLWLREIMLFIRKKPKGSSIMISISNRSCIWMSHDSTHINESW